MDHSDLTVSTFMENSIGLKRVDKMKNRCSVSETS